MLLMGDSLLETLLLNLVRLDGAAAAPFEFEPGRDQPAWERDQVTLPAARSPDGYLDLLTWQSRRVLLLPELRNGSVVVPRIILMKGYQFPEGFEPHTRETMVAYQKRDRAAANQDPWPAVGFQPERALWRDSLALLQRSPRPGDLDRRVPRTFDDLAERVPVGYPVRLVALGLSALRAKVELWREERLPLPLQYLRHDELVYTLGTSLGAAESVRGALMSGVRHLAQGALSPESKPDTGRVRSMVESLGAERADRAALDAPFRTLIVDLAATWAADQGEPALAAWRRALRDTAQQAFDAAAGALETSARGLRAAAEARGLFEAMMARTLRED
jgi:CRISPR system Cascade subunit CasA